MYTFILYVHKASTHTYLQAHSLVSAGPLTCLSLSLCQSHVETAGMSTRTGVSGAHPGKKGRVSQRRCGRTETKSSSAAGLEVDRHVVDVEYKRAVTTSFPVIGCRWRAPWWLWGQNHFVRFSPSRVFLNDYNNQLHTSQQRANCCKGSR